MDAARGSMRLISGPNSSNLRSSSFKSRIPSSAPAPRNSTASVTAAENGVPGRVRVAVRLRPRNNDESVADDFVELQPEVKRLILRKNKDTKTYVFDDVFTEAASQKRVYEVVAKPVVESVLEGYNGTVMAYGQTGTGKTFTLGRLGDEDIAARGIMVRSMEDIIEGTSLESDSVYVSYLQLYMETIQDLLDPTNDNIAIVEDPETGDVSLSGASHVEIRNQQDFLERLQLGETHRVSANTKLNTECSRSHAILMVHVKRSVVENEDPVSTEIENSSHFVRPSTPLVRRSKLLLVDLAGSERVHKSGSKGKMLEEAKSINRSLSALGKCINAIAENRPHVPLRESKLTRLLKDSFGGTARTSLIVTIGPSPRHRGETTSTISFGQRAMKVENMLKIKENFDYKSLYKKLEIKLDKVIAENERQLKSFNDDVEKIKREAENRISEVEKNFAEALEKEKLKCRMEYMESVKKLEEKLILSQQNHENDKHIGELKLRESSESLHAAEEISRKLYMEVAVLKQEKEVLSALSALSQRVDRVEATLASEIDRPRMETDLQKKRVDEVASSSGCECTRNSKCKTSSCSCKDNGIRCGGSCGCKKKCDNREGKKSAQKKKEKRR